MNVHFRIQGLNDNPQLRRQLQADLAGLNGLMAATSARIALQHQREAAPPYQAVAVLAVPGPDIHAAARDHTWLAAWQKVLSRLREQMNDRRRRQTARKKGLPRIHDLARHKTGP